MRRLTSPRHHRPAPLHAALLCALGLASIVTARAADTYRFATTLGNIDVTLRADLAPRTVANFLRYTAAGGMRTVGDDQYNPANGQLLIPAVTYGGKVYTNVTVTVASVVSAGS